MRSGAFGLSLLSTPLALPVLEALEREPRSLRDLRQAIGVPSATTARRQLATFADLEIVGRRQSEMPGGGEYELEPAGAELLEVGRVLQDWLAASPKQPLALPGVPAKGAVKTLVQGWNSKIIRALAARPLALGDLSRLLTSLSYPALKRLLSDLRSCGLVESRSSDGKGPPYGPSPWLRRACGPLLAAARWEHRHAAAAVEGRFDFEAVFLLASLGTSLSDGTSGRCRLAIELGTDSGELLLAGVQLQVLEGTVVSAMPWVKGKADASASGTSSAWARALTSGEPAELYLSGDRRLAREVLDELHHQLFGPQRTL